MVLVRVYVRCQKLLVGARHHDDRILAGLRDENHRHSAAALDGLEQSSVAPYRLEIGTHLSTVIVRADAPPHRDVAAELRRRVRLIGALAARHLEKSRADPGLARDRQARRQGDEVHIQATYY